MTTSNIFISLLLGLQMSHSCKLLSTEFVNKTMERVISLKIKNYSNNYLFSLINKVYTFISSNTKKA